jgi:hypothetical protein
MGLNVKVPIVAVIVVLALAKKSRKIVGAAHKN